MSVGALITWPYKAGGRSRRGSPKAGTTVLLKCRQAPGLTCMHNCSHVQGLGIYSKMNTVLLVVRTLLDIPLGPISIPVAVGPYQKWTEGTPVFHVQRNRRGCIAWLGKQCRDERREYNLSSKMRLVPCFLTSDLLEVY